MTKIVLTLLSGITLIFSGAALSVSLGDVADKVSFTAGIVSHGMWAACIIVGIILIASAFSQYQIHRSNPKAVPLVTPITYLVLALLALCIPFINYLTGAEEGKATSVYSKKTVESQQQQPTLFNIDE